MYKEKLRVGLIGLGSRGRGVMEHTLSKLVPEGLEIAALCDSSEFCTDEATKIAKEITDKAPFVTNDYREVLKLDIDAVIIATAWEDHLKIAIDAMKAGKYVGIEAGGAYSVEECWKLVEASEETGMPCMLLENCCYGKRELMVLEMARQGVLGDIVYCSGGYHHDLRKEIAGDEGRVQYRLNNYLKRNCENYPTHELGPIAKVLSINNGNRMMYLTSTASSAKGMHEYLVDRKGADGFCANETFAQGDIIKTVIKCAGGELIAITLDTTLPRYYSRGFTVRGTKGAYFEDNDSVYLDHIHEEFEFDGKKLWGNAEEYAEKYKHKVWQNHAPDGGHDGMDELVYRAFFESAKRGTQPPIDVYDAAVWMSISPLSEKSISLGGAPVEIPDFTKGKWINRTDIADGDFSLKIK